MTQYIHIGKLGKPFGLQGDIKLLLFDDYLDYVPDEVLFLDRKGAKVPYFVETCKPDLSPMTVKFEEIDDANAAFDLVKHQVYVREVDMPTAFLKRELSAAQAFVGFQIIDKTLGTIGSIQAIDETTPQILAQVIYKGQEAIVPLIAQFIARIDESGRVVEMDLPEGLL